MGDHGIQGKVALIAGGAKSLGGLLAGDLAEHGAKAIAIHYNSAATRAAANETLAAIEKAGAKAAALQGDSTTAGAMERLFADAVAAVGRPDIAVNTVGKVIKTPISEISEAEYDQMSAVNAKKRLLLPERGRQARERSRCDRDARNLAPRCLHAVLFRLCRHQGAGRALHAHGGQGVRRARPLGDRDRSRPDGYVVLLSGRE